jgi:eukaryotic-like serine/threonine-protein kinase
MSPTLVPLSPGQRLGPYEILTAIGAGGMGEVYRARDTRLDRTVALKVIQSSVASNAEMRERFEREARAISALDHPNICMLYDVCRLRVADASASATASADKSASQGREDEISFLVMQYLEGETLADRLARAGKPSSHPSLVPATPEAAPVTATAISTSARGPIPFDTALKWAAEIAHALDAAHRRGIVHRDLKPGNVMITKTGTKLLDFGLAKLAGGELAGSGFGHSGETRTTSFGAQDRPFGAAQGRPFGAAQGRPLTSRGAIMGTLQYMSPEQLEGRDVDTRSDIFSFGAVLFEMLAGRRAFDAPSQAGVIAAIVGQDTPAIGALADAKTRLPMFAERALDRVLAKCLAKHPDDRWQSAADLAAELQWIPQLNNDERLRTVPEPAAASASAVLAPASRTRERLALAACLAAIVALGVVSYLWYPRPGAAPAPVTFTIAAPEGQVFGDAGPGGLGLSPDGRLVVFSTGPNTSRQVWVRDLGSTTLRRIDRASDLWHPFWSPDSRFVAYTGIAPNSQLHMLDLTGGAPRTLVEKVGFDRGAWNRAGVVLFSGEDRKLYRISDAGGPPALVMDLDGSRQENALTWPVFLPDGRRYLFVGRSDNPSNTALFLASLDAPGRTLLAPLFSNVDYAAGHLFYQRAGTLMAHPFDPLAGRLTGEAFPVIEDILFNPGNGRGAFAVSASGTLAYLSGTAIQLGTNTLALFDRAGQQLRQLGPPARYRAVVLSPNGRHAVVTHREDQSTLKLALWFMDMDRGVETRFTVGDADERNPVWSPDGGFVAFQRGPLLGSGDGIYRRSAGGGATTAELLFKGIAAPTGFSPDGKLLLMNREGRIWILPLAGDRTPAELFPGTPETQGDGQFSPDGTWIAYHAGTSNEDTAVYVRPYPADDRRIRVSTAGGRHPQWTADGRQLVYRANDDALMSVELTPVNGTVQPSSPVRLFTRNRQGAPPNAAWYSMDPRGERFLLVVPPDRTPVETSTPITVILNFAQSVRRK